MKNKSRYVLQSEACIRRLYLNRIYPLYRKEHGDRNFKRIANWQTLKQYRFVFVINQNRPFAIYRKQYLWLTNKIFVRLLWSKKGRVINGRKKNKRYR